jgi:hypothetical protein
LAEPGDFLDPGQQSSVICVLSSQQFVHTR